MTQPMPSLKVVHGSLRKITEVLGRELVAPTSRAPSWSPSEWLLARAVAAMHGVSPLLSSALRWQHAPAGWTAFLAEQKAHTALRAPRIQQCLAQIERRARDDGLAVVALKGAALHAIGIYAPGERPMADVDLLVAGGDLDRAVHLLESLCYFETLATTRHLVFEPLERRAPAELGEGGANDVKIELHGRITENLPVETVDISDLVLPHSPHPGINRYPSIAALMTHLVFHAAGGMSARSLRLLHLHDLARLAARMTQSDWQEWLGAGASRPRHFWWAFPPLLLASRYFSCIPSRVLQTAERWCPPALVRTCRAQRLSDVSLSQLWIEAFPGIEWAPSLRAKLQYALKRIVPGHEMIVARTKISGYEPWRSKSDWSTLSQSRRMVRWLTSRPARIETLSAVKAALAQAP